MITVSKRVLKAKMLQFFREIEKTGQELIVTDNNRPVLKVSRLQTKKKPADVFGDVRGKLRVTEKDLLAPETQEWELK
jgi:predicted nicotinamide N-methyase